MKPKVWHDQAHGGDNIGIEYAGIIEKKWTPVIARDCGAVIKSLGLADQRFSRDADIDLDYRHRAQAAAKWGADFAILHHVNGCFHPRGHPRAGQPAVDIDGLMCHHMHGDWIGREVGDAIMRSAPHDLLRHKHRSIPAVTSDWTVDAHGHLRHYAAEAIPAVLIEWAFLTAPGDVAVIEDVRSRPAMCAAVVAGVARLLELG